MYISMPLVPIAVQLYGIGAYWLIGPFDGVHCHRSINQLLHH